MPNRFTNWIEHVKQYAKENNISYGKCLKDANCKQSYQNKKTGGIESENQIKKTRKYTKKIKTEEVPEIPVEILNVIKKRKYTRKIV